MRTQAIHHARTAGLCLLAGLTFGLQGCGPKEAPSAAVAAPSTPAAETKPQAVPSAVPSSATPSPAAQPGVKAVAASGASVVAPAPQPDAGPATLPPAAEVKPAISAPAPVQAQSPISDPGGEVAVKPTKLGLSRVGAASCKMCHKVQFTSWSDTAHAKRNPPLDCESCHGAGSEYKAMATMKDPAKAGAAGLVMPAAPFCATCHKRNWSEGLLKKAHAHKT